MSTSVYDRLVALFTEDGQLNRPDFQARGRGEILALMQRRPLEIETRHLCALPMFLRVSDTEADAVTYFAFHQGEAAVGPARSKTPPTVAEYHDHFRLTEQGWLIASRTVEVALTPSA